MAMVGEQFESHGDNICGAVVNVRQKGDKVGGQEKQCVVSQHLIHICK